MKHTHTYNTKTSQQYVNVLIKLRTKHVTQGGSKNLFFITSFDFVI